MASTSHVTMAERSAITGAVSAAYFTFYGTSLSFAATEGAHLAISRAISEAMLEGIIEAVERFIPSFALHLADSVRIDLACGIVTSTVNTIMGRFTGYNALDDRSTGGFLRSVVYNTAFSTAADFIMSFKKLIH